MGLLIVATLAVNESSHEYPFVYDDNALIVERAPFWEEGFSTFLTTRHRGLGRHLTLVSLDLDRRTPLTPTTFHTTNTALATAVAVAVFTLGHAIGLGLAGALAAALLFAVHPTHVDAVVSIAGRAELLACLGAVLALCLYHTTRRRPLRRRWPAVLVGGFVLLLSLASKENAAVIPALVLLAYACLPATASLGGVGGWLGWSLTGTDRDAAGPTPVHASVQAQAQPQPTADGAGTAPIAEIVVYGVVLAAWLVPVLGMLSELEPPVFVDNPLAHVAWWERIPKAAAVLWRYAFLLMVPLDLRPERAYAQTDPSLAGGGLALVAWLAVVIVAWRMRRRYPVPAFGILWFPLAFAVTGNYLVAGGTIMAERHLFLPSVGPCLAAGWFFARAVSTGTLRRVAATVTLLLITLGAAMAYEARARVWSSPGHYFREAAMRSPLSAKAHYDLAMFHLLEGQTVAATGQLRRALAIAPSFQRATYYLAETLVKQGDPKQALQVYEELLQHGPEDLGAHVNARRLAVQVGDKPSALRHARAVVGLAPDDPANVEFLTRIEEWNGQASHTDARRPPSTPVVSP